MSFMSASQHLKARLSGGEAGSSFASARTLLESRATAGGQAATGIQDVQPARPEKKPRVQRSTTGSSGSRGQQTLNFARKSREVQPQKAVDINADTMPIHPDTGLHKDMEVRSLLVGRQFHKDGGAALLVLAQDTLKSESDDPILLTVEREPSNQYDSNALLVSCSTSTGNSACGHVPKEQARLLSPLMDEGLVSLVARIAAQDVNERPAGSPLVLRLLVNIHAPKEHAERVLSKIASASNALISNTPRPLSKQSASSRGQNGIQCSLLMNFGQKRKQDACQAGTAQSAARLSFSIGATGIFPHVACHMSIRTIAAARAAAREWLLAVDCLQHTRYRSVVEGYIRGHGWALQRLWPQPQCTPHLLTSCILEEALKAVAAWERRRLDFQRVLDVMIRTRPCAMRLAEELCLDSDCGWSAIAIALLTCPSAERLRVARAALDCPGVQRDELRELLALLVICWGSRVGNEAHNVGARRLYADLLVCNRLCEDAGMKLPTQKLKFPGINLTEEQASILLRDVKAEEMMVISAFAGTGKTSTLRMYTSLRPHLKFLYICFNVSVREEAQRSFPSNVTCKNAHQLAFRACGFKFRHKLKDEIRTEDISMDAAFSGLVKLLPKGDGNHLELADACLVTLQNFLNSAATDITENHMPHPLPSILRNGALSAARICAFAQSLWQRMCDVSDSGLSMTHAGYLKLYSLSNPRLRYDCVLLDEAQDCNPAIAQIVALQSCARVLVGDKHQAIYGFLGAQDMMIAADKGAACSLPSAPTAVCRRQLTHSFRFGPNIADVANFLLHQLKGETYPLLGYGCAEGCLLPDPSQTSSNQGPLEGCPRPPFAYIARTNAAVIEMALRADEVGLDVFWVGGVNGYRMDLLCDLCLLAMGLRERAENPRIRSFQSIDAIRNFARRVDDRDLLARIKRVQASDASYLLSRLRCLKTKAEKLEQLGDSSAAAAAVVKSKSGAAVWLATVHKAKGLEWDTVMIADDFMSPEELTHEGSQFGESTRVQEVNALYVAVTRARRALQLPSEFAAAYMQHAEAAALVEPADVAAGGSCPFCGQPTLEVSNVGARGERRARLVSEASSRGLVMVGSVTLRQLCSSCAARAGACRIRQPKK
mmetsp:Transcript_72638/g.132787  ORF Transcript_72638/g.132787 Transcript_72638/m.132787 type:complete len:1113 (+) Transcript_72638:23-3361(+)